jgi:predicted nucleotide-binding protein
MPPINPKLLERLASKLGVSNAQVYARIQKVANDKILDRNHAALVLAAASGINIQKYSSPEDRAAIRGSIQGTKSPSESTTEQSAPSVQLHRPTKPNRLKRPFKTKDNSVFVVHGRDEGLRKSMFDFLRALSLNPLEWGKAVIQTKRGGANPHIDDVIDSAMARVQAVVVIFSPDDLAYLRPCFLTKGEKATEGRPQGQPRPNVIFEAGLALGRHPEKTLLVQVGTVRGFSDIAGKHLVRLNNDASRRTDVVNRLRKIGCAVDVTGTDWLSDGDFTPKKDEKTAGRKKPSKTVPRTI